MTLKIGRYKYTFHNLLEFLFIYWGIFILKEYKVKLRETPKIILDCGSHIGLSVLYFKRCYPMVEIIAFEPNPVIFKLLNSNIKQNNIFNISLINSALAKRSGQVKLFLNKKNSWSWSNTCCKVGNQKRKQKHIKVASSKLSEYINQEIDLLKLDIEGMEGDVLNEIGHKLNLIKNITLEYHRTENNKTNNIQNILFILDKFSFTYKITEKKIFYSKEISSDKAKQRNPFRLHVYASRN